MATDPPMTDPALATAATLIAKFEAFRSHPYLDSANIPTIGYGATYLPDGSRVTMQTPAVTQEAAYAALTTAVGKVMALVRGMVHVPVSDNAVCALVSLAYNIGTNALRTSTLLRLLNQGEASAAGDRFGEWCYAGGQVVAGLVQRRKLEREWFLHPDPPVLQADPHSPQIRSPGEVEADRLMDAHNPAPVGSPAPQPEQKGQS